LFTTITLTFSSLLVSDITIQQAAPDTTIAFVSATNIGDVLSKLETAGSCDKICAAVSSGFNIDYASNAGSAFEGLCDAMGISSEDFTPPSGYAGAALYPVVDFESGTVGLGGIAMIQLDEKVYGEFFSEMMETSHSAPSVDSEIVSLVGRDVMMLQYEIPELDMPLMNLDLEAFEKSYVVYTDGYLIVGSEPDGIASALLALDGEVEPDMLETNEDYITLYDRCGGEGDVFGGVLLTNLADTAMQIDDSNMAMMIMPSVKTLFGDIDGIAQTATLSPSEDVLLEATYTVLMNDGRSGLMSIIGENTTQSPKPVFVGDDTLMYAQGVLDLNKLVPVLRDTIMGQPMLSMQIGPQMEMFEAGLTSFLAPLGSKFHTVSTGTMPLNMETVGTLFAIECNDEEAFGGTLSMTLPAMGATPTDFLGNQIYTIDLGAVIPVSMPMEMEYSIAVGGGYVFIGTQRNVENALRATANPKDTLTTETTDLSVMLGSDDVSSLGYGDIGKSIAVQMAMQTATTDNMLKEMESFDPQMAEEMRNSFAESSDIYATISELFVAILGPASWDLKTDEHGMTSRIIVMQSAK
jgi:hypothetical protein